jgi:hypothetical protein
VRGRLSFGQKAVRTTLFGGTREVLRFINAKHEDTDLRPISGDVPNCLKSIHIDAIQIGHVWV